jgi:hypothetical protein
MVLCRESLLRPSGLQFSLVYSVCSVSSVCSVQRLLRYARNDKGLNAGFEALAMTTIYYLLFFFLLGYFFFTL